MTNRKEGLVYEMNFQHFDPHLNHSNGSSTSLTPLANQAGSSTYFYDALLYGSSTSLNPLVNIYDHYQSNIFVQNGGYIEDGRNSNIFIPHYASNQVDIMGSNQSPTSINQPELKTMPDAHVTDFRKKSVDRSWKGLKKQNIIKGQWAIEEDRLLRHLVQQYGVRKWTQIAKMLPGRIGKQCRERWHNHLKPGINKDLWSEDEDRILIQAHREIGNKWAEIAKRLPGRTENTIKNHWNATTRTKYARATLLEDYIKSLNLDKAAETPGLSMVEVQPQPLAHEFNQNNNINNSGFLPNYGLNEFDDGGCSIEYLRQLMKEDNYVSIADDHKSFEAVDDAPSAAEPQSLSMIEVQPQQQAMKFNQNNPEFVTNYGLDDGGCNIKYFMENAPSMDW